jgi:hypothetical protein
MSAAQHMWHMPAAPRGSVVRSMWIVNSVLCRCLAEYTCDEMSGYVWSKGTNSCTLALGSVSQ